MEHTFKIGDRIRLNLSRDTVGYLVAEIFEKELRVVGGSTPWPFCMFELIEPAKDEFSDLDLTLDI